MNLFMIIPLFLVVTTGLWEQAMAQENAKEKTLDTENHHVMKVSVSRLGAGFPQNYCDKQHT